MELKIIYTILATASAVLGFATANESELQNVTLSKKLTPFQVHFNLSQIPSYKEFDGTRRSEGDGQKRWLFKDYLMKYNPIKVFNRIAKRKMALGQNASVEKDFNEIYEGIDLTDDLLKLDILSSEASGRRKWTPPGTLNLGVARNKDVTFLRQRFFELIRHVIYQTRNRMVLMQVMRAKYRNSSLYKMGFLISKTDVACKTFHGFAFKVIHPCPMRYYDTAERYEIISMMHAQERLQNKWFEIELLIDLIHENDLEAKKVIKKYKKQRKQRWKFEE